jgi:glycosyltransferase involved in cell wall biosynthesis
MKIGYLVPEFPGQTHAFFWREIRALEVQGVEPVLFSTRRPPSAIVSHDWAKVASQRTTYLSRPSPSAFAVGTGVAAAALVRGLAGGAAAGDRAWFAQNALVLAPFAAELTRQARLHGVKHVHVHSCARAAAIALMSRLSGGPTYSLTLHGDIAGYGPGQRTKWQNAAFAMVVTETLKRQVQAQLAGHLPPLHVQAMGVDTDHFSRVTPYGGAAPGSPVRIFSCGRLNPGKGHQDLIDAIAMLVERGMDARLVIAGQDEQGGSGFARVLQARIDAAHLRDQVTLLGAVSEQAVRQYLLEATVFVLASRDEAIGVAYMEAMSCEVPVVGTNVGGVGELIEDGRTGILVAPESVPDIVAAVEYLVQHPDVARRLGQAGREVVVSRFGADRSATALREALGALSEG